MSSRSNGVINVWFKVVIMAWVISSPRCSMACSLSSRSAMLAGFFRMSCRRRAPSVTFCDTSANMRKNLVSRGIRRIMKLGAPRRAFRLISRDARNAQLSHAGFIPSNRRLVAGEQVFGPAEECPQRTQHPARQQNNNHQKETHNSGRRIGMPGGKPGQKDRQAVLTQA